VSDCEELVELLTGDQSGGTQIYCPQYIKPVLYTLPWWEGFSHLYWYYWWIF